MSDFLALGGVIAAWLAISVALWLGRRLWIRSRQNKRLAYAVSAAGLARGASAVFDTIRAPSSPDDAPSDPSAYLRSETHALLNRIQQQGGYFDEVNSLRVNIQAAIGVDDHKGLSDILDLRRDLWATSEIILVEDPAQFGRTFADEGAFKRFHAEAVRTLFKLPELAGAGDDVIGLRVALAVKEAERFEAELAADITEARERDRLPTPAELAAYPVAWIRTIPVALAAGAAFAKAFYAHAWEMSRRIRSSETVTRGTARMRQMGEDWPQRLSDGFQRATETARENASSFRDHYDFLAAAHDFKGKYQTLIQRAPELSDRSRQFIARLELAERSERLRLTSANAAIWTMRKAVDGLAHAIAFLRRSHAGLQGTAPYALAVAAIAPVPVRGRRMPAFRSYRRALAANGLREPLAGPVILVEEEPRPSVSAKRRTTVSAKTAKRRDDGKTAGPRRTIRERIMAAARPAPKPATPAKVVKKSVPTAVKAEKPAAPIRTPAKTSLGEGRALFGLFGRSGASGEAAVKTKPKPLKVKTERKTAKIEAAPVAIAPLPANPQLEVSPPEQPVKAAKPSRPQRTPKKEKPAAPIIAKVEPPADKIEAPLPEKVEVPVETVSRPPKIAATAAVEEKRTGKDDGSALKAEKLDEPAPVDPIVETADRLSLSPPIEDTGDILARPEKRGSFLGRLFGHRKTEDRVHDEQYEDHQDADPWSLDAWDDAAARFEAPSAQEPVHTPLSLLDKLSSLDVGAGPELFDDAIAEDDDADNSAARGEAEPAEHGPDDFEPLTQSLMELQVRIKPSPPQIKAFPWLRH